jgi:hypothetical protein
MDVKIVGLARSCGGCPNKRYSSGGRSECAVTGLIIPDLEKVASFCPLVDFPSRKLSEMENTIMWLQQPNKYSLILAICAHIAIKLKTTMDERGQICLTLKDGGAVILHPEYISEVALLPGAVLFLSDGKKYKLHPDGETPTLYQEVKDERVKEPLWRELDLAS